jgi:hypothetical protein
MELFYKTRQDESIKTNIPSSQIEKNLLEHDKDQFNSYASVEMMQYCNHPHDTQTNEALNQAIANVAPKSMCYSGTYSLNSCIGVIIGVHNLGIHDFGNS